MLDWIMGDADAHTCLQAVYNDPAATQGNRIKAAAASLPFEKPKLISVAPAPDMDRRERWRLYERWALKKQIIRETHHLPLPGWDAHLVGDIYQPPSGEDMPPVDIVPDPTSGVRVLTNLLPKPGKQNGQ